eukprot:PLAT5721.2.p1 GENE.PLAT5721.2~~PLAT5721.2.p1  ORF type:complete len:412 (+),score=220.84 PLAT5721.2:162-1238(+)
MDALASEDPFALLRAGSGGVAEAVQAERSALSKLRLRTRELRHALADVSNRTVKREAACKARMEELAEARRSVEEAEGALAGSDGEGSLAELQEKLHEQDTEVSKLQQMLDALRVAVEESELELQPLREHVADMESKVKAEAAELHSAGGDGDDHARESDLAGKERRLDSLCDVLEKLTGLSIVDSCAGTVTVAVSDGGEETLLVELVVDEHDDGLLLRDAELKPREGQQVPPVKDIIASAVHSGDAAMLLRELQARWESMATLSSDIEALRRRTKVTVEGSELSIDLPGDSDVLIVVEVDSACYTLADGVAPLLVTSISSERRSGEMMRAVEDAVRSTAHTSLKELVADVGRRLEGK